MRGGSLCLQKDAEKKKTIWDASRGWWETAEVLQGKEDIRCGVHVSQLASCACRIAHYCVGHLLVGMSCLHKYAEKKKRPGNASLGCWERRSTSKKRGLNVANARMCNVFYILTCSFAF